MPDPLFITSEIHITVLQSLISHFRLCLVPASTTGLS
jgi:hypothetical protein